MNKLILDGMIASIDAMNQAMGIVEGSKYAAYSTHDIARHLLSLPDREVEYGYDQMFSEDELGDPKRPFVPAVYTPATQERMNRLFNRNTSTEGGTITIRKPVQFRSIGDVTR